MSDTEMTKDKGLAFLRAHQPMPDTLDSDNDDVEELLQQWDEVRMYFVENPCLEAIPLFLGSIGDPDGLGVYQCLESNLDCFEPEQIVPYLIEALNSPSDSIRQFTAELSYAVDSDDPAFIEALIGRLDDENAETRSNSSGCLVYLAENGFFDWRKYEKRLRELAAREEDKGVLLDYDEIFNS